MKPPRKKYWLGLEETPSKGEFLRPLPSEKEGVARREFLQLMGAGLALTAGGCLRRPTEKIVPYIKRPEDVLPGEANFYASSYYDGGEGFSIVVKTREGRPIKIEGNEEAVWLNGSGLSPRAEAHILSLYDPERLKGPKRNLFNDQKTNRETIGVSYESADQAVTAKLKQGRTALLTPRIPSPSFKALVRDFKRVFPVQHFLWDPLSLEEALEGQKTSYNFSHLPSYDFSRAKFIFSLNCDFLGAYLSPAEFQRQFAVSRRASSQMSRLVVLESLMSLTGANGDERYRIRPSDQLPALLSLISALGKRGLILPSQVSSLAQNHSAKEDSLSIPSEKWDEWAGELLKWRGQGLILFGGVRGRTRDSKTLHILVNFLNSALGNDGKTINYRQAFPGPFGSEKSMEQLISGLEKGHIKRVIIHKVNPLYSSPQKERLKTALKKADLVVYTGDRVDETGLYSDYILPDSHDLEKWGDWEFKSGVFSVGQPTIRPLYQTRAFEDALLVWIRSVSQTVTAENFYSYVKNRWKAKRGAAFWNRFLKAGVTGPPKEKFSLPSRSFQPSAWNTIRPPVRRTGAPSDSAGKSQSYELALYETSGLRHGDLSNVSWLMEFPDPVTKICWDNYLCLSSAEALERGLKEGDVVSLKSSGTFPHTPQAVSSVKSNGTVSTETGEGLSLEVPIHIQPGQSDGVLALALGYGRTGAGSIGNGVGVSAWPFLKSDHFVSFEKTGKAVPLANVQGHHSMEGRDIVLETTLKEFLKDPSSGLHKSHKVKSLWSSHKYKGHKWGMVIDLNSCTGCGTCLLACQSENNIPTVGKKNVLDGREMHWIRVDRYYEGPPENPRTVHQPVVCMHCDNAPCETVCPVLATVHSDEGTNDMIYNRCVGTRYCSNNCPYKVRRFNWFNYAKKIKEPLNKVLNPDVTVRSRGVMEKCTFCIQRIHQAKGEAKRENRPLKDGELKTACQQSCPAEAISFGDLNDPHSRVRGEFHAENSYALLDDHLNTKPSVKYKTKIRNIKKLSHKGDH